MSGNTFGTLFRITTWGESHGYGVGVVIDGCPAGLTLDESDIQKELDRRRPGQSEITTQRKEEDKAEVDPRQVLELIQDYVDKNCEDVGLDFTKEALKIHYGESKKRNIKGTATPDQETLLKQEGVQFFKIPIVKRLDN